MQLPLPPRTAASYEDSVSPHESDSVDEAALDSDFFCKVDELWHEAGYGSLDPSFDGRLHRLPIMSRCSVYEPALNTWRFFADLETCRFLATSLQWELSSGLVVIHCGARTCLLFRSQAAPEPMEPSEAMQMLVDKPASAICLVVQPTKGGHEVAHLELRQALGSRERQTRQRNVLDKLLRALIASYDVAFWRPE